MADSLLPPGGAFPLASSNVDAIVFDFGGVLLPLAYGETERALSELLGVDARRHFSFKEQSSLFQRFERGQLTPEEFRAELSREVLGAPDRLPAAALREAFCALLGDLPEENLRLLRALRAQKRVFLLSNTNALHIEHFYARYAETRLEEHGSFARHFEALYLSSELGLRKPEPAIYQHVIRDALLQPSRTVFLDDNAENVRAARAAGFLAYRHDQNAALWPWFREILPDFEASL